VSGCGDAVFAPAMTDDTHGLSGGCAVSAGSAPAASAWSALILLGAWIRLRRRR
jgi:MYXO-CTERM domain-containing protein